MEAERKRNWRSWLFRLTLKRKMFVAILISLVLSTPIANIVNQTLQEFDWVAGLLIEHNLMVYINQLINLLVTTAIILVGLQLVILRPLKRVREATAKVAQGELNVEVKADSRDEVGELSASVNKMIENLGQLIDQVNESVYASANEVAATSNHVSDELTKVHNSAEEASSHTKNVVTDAKSGNEAVLEASQALMELSSLIQIAKEKAQSAENNSNETLRATEDGNTSVQETADRMAQIKAQTTESERWMESLSSYSEQIKSVASTITNIAEQTNLLALNAAIEAARAGESGKGFAVVAEEVRKLADQSNREASQVTELVGHMASDTERAVDAAKKSREEAEVGVQFVHRSGESLNEIVQAVESTVHDIREIASTANEEVASSEQIISLIDSVATTIENTAQNAEQLSEHTDQTSEAMAEVQNRVETLQKMAGDLKATVAQFST
ncbi:methyl-accepting chemotaxis protein [Salsuginibacillus halophilus]|uniref:Methyl-accepting chemotaxis protein n=1 Tax=Salsuginibacillus halophilus TaxID=517424 RepID=A0A2P8HLC9_9BACI|nr:methyl-accepting chemotaxis protein [Salsuginibacillus halophilus]PSL47023.1 methyl-accepting chemotaxis protein [Salsuginibacillus halophilus]